MAVAELRQVRQDRLSTFKQSLQLSSVPAKGVSHSTQQEKKRKRPDDKKPKRPETANRNQSSVEPKSLRASDFDNIDVNLDSDAKLAAVISDNFEEDIDDEVEIPIDDDESGSGFRRHSADVPISDNYQEKLQTDESRIAEEHAAYRDIEEEVVAEADADVEL